MDDLRDRDVRLLQAIKEHLPQLEVIERQLAARYEDGVYRFYHQSAKVYQLQALTEQVVAVCRSLAATTGGRLSPFFEEIIAVGTDHVFQLEHNRQWTTHTRPIVEAFGHVCYITMMLVRYGNELETPPALLPSGWAAVLELFGFR